MLTVHREDARGFVVANFLSLEDQLLDCMKYIPYIEQNLGVVSPKFVPILLDACSLIDSVLRHSTDDDSKRSLKRHAALLEPNLELEHATTLFLVSPLQLLRPFRGWTAECPDWWAAHNQVKHDRVRNYSAATYAHTIMALAGLHQVVSRSWSFLSQLILHGWFNESSEQFIELMAARAAGSGPPGLPAHSSLFVSPIRDDFVDWSKDRPTIEQWDFTERVKNHIWQWEGW